MNGKEGHVEYRIGRQWTTDTVFGDAGEGRLGVFWSTRFGSNPPPAPADDWGMDDKPNRRRDDDGDGIENAFDLCRAVPEDKDAFEDEDGCPEVDNDADGIPDAKDKAPLRPETYNGYQDEDGVPDQASSPLVDFDGRVVRIGFPRGSARLSKSAQETLRATAELIDGIPTIHVVITGHSDRPGGKRANLQISRARAQAGAKYLRRLGLSKDRIRSEGVGSMQLLDPSGTKQGHAKSRRLEVTLRRVEPPTAPERGAR